MKSSTLTIIMEETMFKRSVLFGVILSVFMLAGLTLPNAGQARTPVDPTNLNYSYHMITIPYNIKVATWWTGINIVGSQDNLRLEFWSNGVRYATKYLSTDDHVDKTEMIEDFLPPRIAFRSPTTLCIYSEKDKFFVSQFISDGTGFGFQTFNSYPCGFMVPVPVREH